MSVEWLIFLKRENPVCLLICGVLMTMVASDGGKIKNVALFNYSVFKRKWLNRYKLLY